MERTSRLAIAGSLLWVAVATGVILGTHGEAVASADGAGVTTESAAEWLVHPATDRAAPFEDALRQC